MSLQNRIIKDYKYFTKAQDKEKCRVYKVIIGEMQRLKEKILSDELVITLLNKMINSENEMPNGGDIIFKEICLTYLPKKATNEEIELWINENIDFSIYKNKILYFIYRGIIYVTRRKLKTAPILEQRTMDLLSGYYKESNTLLSEKYGINTESWL